MKSMEKFMSYFTDDNNPSTWYKKGKSFYTQGKLQEAQNCVDKALKIDPSFSKAQELVRLIHKRNLVRELVEAGRQDHFEMSKEFIKQVDEDFFSALKTEAAYLRLKGNARAADWLENEAVRNLNLMKMMFGL